jgi:hypothetical protein
MTSQNVGRSGNDLDEVVAVWVVPPGFDPKLASREHVRLTVDSLDNPRENRILLNYHGCEEASIRDPNVQKELATAGDIDARTN